MRIRLIIFDLDGTLVDTVEDLRASLNHAIAPLGISPLTYEQTRDYVGEGIHNLVLKVIGQERRSILEDVVDAFTRHYTQNVCVHSKAYAGVDETLCALDGISKAVLSNKREALSRLLLERLGLAHHFEVIAGPDTVPERKPSPRAVQFMLERFNVRPEEALMVGDSIYDIDAALAAGVEVAAATYGFRHRSTLTRATYLIDSFPDLLRLGPITN